ncbi:hypothetical protein GCM10010353_70640 [Streptomyces chryseus]|nr:hypothetical protein GCM10010353_70640 [Streptomyces chryseus]
MEDWAEIRRLHRAEQMPVRAIARRLGIARNTVRRAIADDAPPKCQGAEGSIAVKPQISELLEQCPEMPATVIAERIAWDRGLTVLKDQVRDLRRAYARSLAPEAADHRTSPRSIAASVMRSSAGSTASRGTALSPRDTTSSPSATK